EVLSQLSQQRYFLIFPGKTKLKRLRYIVDSRKRKTNLKEQFSWLGLKENIFKKMAQKQISKDKLVKKYLHEKDRGRLPKYISSTSDNCLRFREELRIRGNMFQGQPVIECNPLFRQTLSTKDPKTLKNLPKADKLVDSARGRSRSWAEEGPFQAWLDAQNTWFQGDEEEAILYSGYEFIPSHSKYRYFIKWDGKGWYAALTEPKYGLTGRVKLKIQLNTYFTQMPYPNVITVRRVPWSILNIDSTNIKGSNFIGGFEFFETDVLFEPEEIVLITQEMQLYVCSINYAFAIIDFRGWDDDPYWVNFGLFGIPDED
ncbi:MAG: hypothetical protein PVG70_19775, partial [Desulfobacterales bacterium]